MRVAHYEFDSLVNNAGVMVPDHLTQKKLYIGNGSMEVDYVNQNASGESIWKMDRMRIYIPGPDGRAGSVEIDPEIENAASYKKEVYHYDHLGSIAAITDFNNNSSSYMDDLASKDSLYSYDAWGERRDAGDWTGTAASQSAYSKAGDDDLASRGFTGHEMLDNLGLVHMNGRIYDPVLGRFLSADLVVQCPDRSQSYNRYSYVNNNPLSLFDPSGYTIEIRGTGTDEQKKELGEKFKNAIIEAGLEGEFNAVWESQDVYLYIYVDAKPDEGESSNSSEEELGNEDVETENEVEVDSFHNLTTENNIGTYSKIKEQRGMQGGRTKVGLKAYISPEETKTQAQAWARVSSSLTSQAKEYAKKDEQEHIDDISAWWEGVKEKVNSMDQSEMTMDKAMVEVFMQMLEVMELGNMSRLMRDTNQPFEIGEESFSGNRTHFGEVSMTGNHANRTGPRHSKKSNSKFRSAVRKYGKN